VYCLIPQHCDISLFTHWLGHVCVPFVCGFKAYYYYYYYYSMTLSFLCLRILYVNLKTPFYGQVYFNSFTSKEKTALTTGLLPHSEAEMIVPNIKLHIYRRFN